MLVSPAAIASAGDDELLLVCEDFADDLARFVVLDDGTEGHTDDLVLAGSAVFVASLAVFTPFRADGTQMLEVEERGSPFVADEDHAPASSTITTRRTAKGYVRFAAEGDGAVTAGPGLDAKDTLVYEPHARAVSDMGAERQCKAQPRSAISAREGVIRPRNFGKTPKELLSFVRVGLRVTVGVMLLGQLAKSSPYVSWTGRLRETEDAERPRVSAVFRKSRFPFSSRTVSRSPLQKFSTLQSSGGGGVLRLGARGMETYRGFFEREESLQTGQSLTPKSFGELRA